MSELDRLIIESIKQFEVLSLEQKKAMREAQRDSFVRSVVDWPKPKFRWENGVKIYESYEDYCND